MRYVIWGAGEMWMLWNDGRRRWIYVDAISKWQNWTTFMYTNKYILPSNEKRRWRKRKRENKNIYIFGSNLWCLIKFKFSLEAKAEREKKNKQKSKWQYANESLQRLCRFYFVSDTHSFEESEKEKKEKNIVQVPIYMSTKIICQFPLNNHSSYVHQHSRRIEKEKKEKYSLKLCHDSMPNETTTNYVCAVRSLCSRIERCQSE